MSSNRGERIVKRTLFLMKAGKAKSWSHAMEIAAKAERDAAAPEGESLQTPQTTGERRETR